MMNRSKLANPIAPAAGEPPSGPGRGLLIVLTAVLLAVTASGQQPAVDFVVESETAYVNEEILAELQITNFDGEPPDEIVIPDCVVKFAGGPSINSVHSNRFGKVEERVTKAYQYRIRPTRVGTITIPAIEVSSKDRAMRTRPKQIEVRQSDANNLLSAEIVCEADKLYVGQQARFTLNISVKAAVAYDQLLDANWMYNQIDPRRRGFGLFPPPTRYDTQGRGADSVYVFSTSADIVLEQPGAAEFPDVDVTMVYPTKFRLDIFRDITPAQTRRLSAKPKVKAPPVLPLPPDNRPANFNGAVGVFQIDVTATPTAARVGDPIDLQITIRGVGPIATLPGPNLAAMPALTDGFRVPNETLAGDVRDDGRTKRFTQTIRAKRSDVTEIPPIEFPYFNPKSGSYEVARSQSIRVTIAMTEQLDAADLSAAPPAPAESASQTPIDNLRENRTSEAELLARPLEITPTAVAVAVFTPPTVFGLFAVARVVSQARGADPARRRRANARRSAGQRIEAAQAAPLPEQAAGIAAAVSGYFADRLNDHPARFAGRGAVDHLRARRVAPAVIEQGQELLAALEQAAYGGGAADARLAALAQALLDALERERL